MLDSYLIDETFFLALSAQLTLAAAIIPSKAVVGGVGSTMQLTKLTLRTKEDES